MSRVTEAMRRRLRAAEFDVPKTQPFGRLSNAPAEGARLEDYPSENAVPFKSPLNPPGHARASFGKPTRDVHNAWYAIWTKSRHEQVVREQLELKGYEVFLPTVTRVMRWKDRKKKVDWPLFPGYCFAHFHKDQRLAILSCTGVVNILAFNGEIAPVEEHEIESIRRLIGTHLPYDPCPLIREGMMVEVVHGPLLGVRGCLVRKGTQDRLILAVELIGQAVSVEIDAADVKAF